MAVRIPTQDAKAHRDWWRTVRGDRPAPEIMPLALIDPATLPDDDARQAVASGDVFAQRYRDRLDARLSQRANHEVHGHPSWLTRDADGSWVVVIDLRTALATSRKAAAAPTRR